LSARLAALGGNDRMHEPIDPMASNPLPAGWPITPRAWLDALSAGTSDEGTVVRVIQQITTGSPDESWEVVSLIDQYYRRGKLAPEVFKRLQSHFQSAALAIDLGGSIGTAMPPARPSAALRRIEPAVNQVLRGRYRLQKLLGRGGMGNVFEAVDQFRVDLPGSGHRLAIKIFNIAVTRQPELFGELRREFQLLQSLSHPNIIRVHDFDRDGDTAFITMELLHGSLLGHLLRADSIAPMDQRQAFAIVRGVCDALAHAHSRGVQHAQVSPKNIFITSDGGVRLFDFGASRPVACCPTISDFEFPQQFSVATPDYASYQILAGQQPGARDSLHAIACLACTLLTGSHPYIAGSAGEAGTGILKSRRPDGLSRPQWRALRSALSYESAQRPSDLGEWLNQLDPQHTGRPRPTSGKRANGKTAACALSLIMAAGILALLHYYPPADPLAQIAAGTTAVLKSGGSFLMRLVSLPSRR
jgi:hypothetical protein